MSNYPEKSVFSESRQSFIQNKRIILLFIGTYSNTCYTPRLLLGYVPNIIIDYTNTIGTLHYIGDISSYNEELNERQCLTNDRTYLYFYLYKIKFILSHANHVIVSFHGVLHNGLFFECYYINCSRYVRPRIESA